jgi:hypothetical protein
MRNENINPLPLPKRPVATTNFRVTEKKISFRCLPLKAICPALRKWLSFLWLPADYQNVAWISGTCKIPAFDRKNVHFLGQMV